jgi:hypothetical protein
MKHQPPIVSDSLEQMRLESIALRRELGLPGGRLTEEQQQTYLNAKSKRWSAENDRRYVPKSADPMVEKPTAEHE